MWGIYSHFPERHNEINDLFIVIHSYKTFLGIQA